jgi:hypothetical protein
LHDEIPKGVRGSIDETRSLQVAAIGCRLAATRSPVKGVQHIEGIPQFPGKAADCRRLLLTDLIFKDVPSRLKRITTTLSATWCLAAGNGLRHE